MSNSFCYFHPKQLRMNKGTVGPMSDDVKSGGSKRRYSSTRRLEQAAATRRDILAAARELFVADGYLPTTVATIAARAGVSVDTVYAAVGRKPALLRELVETAISGTDTPIPGAQRDYVARMHDAHSAPEALRIYAAAITGIQQRLAPVFLALRSAAATDRACAELRTEIAERRARNMRLLVADLRRTGDLRVDLTDDRIADIIWSMNSTEYWELLVRERSWSPEEFETYLADAWIRLLLVASSGAGPGAHPADRSTA
jgi:AcrR family transcriptional regulator